MGACIIMSEYFNQIIYGVKSFITGMRLTLNHFNKKKDLVATLQYPHEKWPVPERDIGFDHSDYNLIRSRLHVDIDDCIACMQCERACPVDCIKIDSIKPPKDNDFDCGMTSNDTQKKMIVSRFTIDMSECMYCNLCVFPCPEECIYMVGGPNDTKHEIDYEFSQYQRDGMIFEFADATDEMIKNAGGDKWIEQRDVKLSNLDDMSKIKEFKELGDKKDTGPKIEKPIEDVSKDKVKNLKISRKFEDKAYGDLNVKSFNAISDKMSRGIAKKIFLTSSKRQVELPEIINKISEALTLNKKMIPDVQVLLDGFSNNYKPDLKSKDVSSVAIKDVDIGESSSPAEAPQEGIGESAASIDIDIKDLNEIEDKMKRGTAKKAYTAAKRTGEDKVGAIRTALADANMLDDSIISILSKFEPSVSSDSKEASLDISKQNKALNGESSQSSQEHSVPKELQLFDIKDLNVIEDKMARGMAKKIFTAV